MRSIFYFLQSIKIITHPQKLLIIISSAISTFSIAFFYHEGFTLAYGDAESHLNIAKRVVNGVTPGLAQLGGVWLPLPHLLMIPFITQNNLWQSGLGGAFFSGICFVFSVLIIYRIILLFTKNIIAGFVGSALFILNANILYMQSTPMSELPLIVFFLLSLYFYFIFLENDHNLLSLITSGFFAFCASLTRYDGWFLVGFEFIGIILFYFPRGLKNCVLEGKAILFGTIGFFGIVLWLLWDQLILGNALYFTNSPFSAKSQQQGWMAKGELPGYKNLWESFLYYFVTSLENIGIILFICVFIGLVFFIFNKKQRNRFIIILLLLVPFIFYVVTMYMGQSVIFIPSLTPKSYQWQLFNVRYGIMMIPTAAILFGILYNSTYKYLRFILAIFLFIQSLLFFSGLSPIITLQDGTHGLSASSHPDAQYWLRKNYNGGYILLDDYARTVSITGSHLPIQKVIYIGNKPYWQDSLNRPEKYVQWIILQKNDAVWTALYINSTKQANLYKYYEKAYTSPNILIFKRNPRFNHLQVKIE